jgi:hypothetical protein
MRILKRLVRLRRAIVPRNIHEPSEEFQSPSVGDINSPHRDAPNGRQNNIMTSSRLTFISPTGKWNEYVSGRHRSRNVAISEESYWKHVMRCPTRI